MARFYSIGYGNQPWSSFERLLHQHSIDIVVDVRSIPESRNPSYTRDALRTALSDRTIDYVFMGRSLGGRPQAAECYDEQGHVDYARMSQNETYQRGIARLLRTQDSERSIALLCSESKPEECHRSKLISMSLLSHGVDVLHIRPDSACTAHSSLLKTLTGGQSTLAGTTIALKSRRRYR